MRFIEPQEHTSSVHRWLRSSLGKALIRQESRIIEDTLDGIFGEQLLQIGLWGEARGFLKYSRTQRSAVLAGPERIDAGERPDLIANSYRLPIASESIDAVLLPHTLDYCDRPHDVLREVHRVLRADGHLVILGFKPAGLWGLRRLLPGPGLPPGAPHLISDRQLSDWIRLLDLRIQGLTRYFFRWPIPGNRGPSSKTWEHRGQRWWPELAACYMLTAQKRVYTLTPIRQRWLSTPKVVGGLVKPTTRLSRIRFDKEN